MADFKTAFLITVIGNEGGLNPGNGEAFTYRGIDESQNPNWPGFKKVHAVWDANKHLGIAAVNKLLAEDAELQQDIESFYLANYWNSIRLSDIKDQQVANILFDDNVNPCEISCARVMQTACNDCGLNPPLVIDGIIGPKSVAAINSIPAETYYKEVVGIRSLHYHDEVIKHPAQRQWLSVWLARIKPFKNNYTT